MFLVFKGLKYGFAKNQMIQGKSLKLKLGLCGLALTSFLALNARGNTVHADTVSGTNADAITWDADNDDSQVVKEEPQQDNASQSVQKQATVQSNAQIKQASATPNVQTQGAVQEQKAPVTQSVQSAQKPVAVQSNMQVKQSQPKVAVSNVSSTPVQQNRAEKSTVLVSNVNTSAVNRLSADNQVNVAVANVDATVSNEPVSITNPAGDVVKVHYVDSNGKAVSGINDASINVSKSGTGKYTVPNGYQLVNPNGTYTITSNKHVVHHPAETHVVHHDATGHYEEVQTGYGWSNSGADNESGSMTEDEYNQFVNEHGGDSAVGLSGDTTTTVSPTYSDEWVEDSPAWDETVVDKKAWDETVGDDTFTDKSGNAKSATGNVVNVVVTKPQNVDPNSAQCKKQATRVIHIAFPNGVKPESYDSITDSAGNKLALDSNNNLTQTVTFTRSETVDSLTGTTLTQTPWQQQGAINAVTLPDIPGYTMVTSN